MHHFKTVTNLNYNQLHLGVAKGNYAFSMFISRKMEAMTCKKIWVTSAEPYYPWTGQL